MNKFKFGSLILALSSVFSSVVLAEVVMPEEETPVIVSNRDVNRFVCTNGDINNVYFSEEKGLIVTNDGKNAYVKFRIKQIGDHVERVSVRSELYIVCGGSVYTLIMEPQDIDAKTYRLAAGTLNNIKANMELYGPKPEEDRALDLTMAALKDDIPDSFTVIKPKNFARDWRSNVIPNAEVSRVEDVIMEGVGLSLTVYEVLANQSIALNETQFLDRFFGTNIFAVTIETIGLTQGDRTRVFVVQKEVK